MTDRMERWAVLAFGLVLAWNGYALAYRGEYGAAVVAACSGGGISTLWWRIR